MPAKPNCPSVVPTRCKHLAREKAQLPHMMSLSLELTPAFAEQGHEVHLSIELCVWCAGGMTGAIATAMEKLDEGPL